MPAAAMAALPAFRPHLAWIMADDMGVGELGINAAASPIRTPHLDALAREGLRFTDAYAGYTVCAPSRATFFTGRNSGHLTGAPGPAHARWPLLPALLARAGYETAIFGKSAPMDDAMPRNELNWGGPLGFGFETFLGQDSQEYCHNMYPTAVTNGSTASGGARPLKLPRNTRHKSRGACMAKPADYNYTTDMFADAALGWLRGRASSRPFFLYASFTVPHAGGWGSWPDAPEQGAPVPYDMGYAAEPWPEVERDHAASLSYLDLRVGGLLGALDTLGIAERTVVFFASDNGPHNEGGHDVRFFDSSGGLRGYKRSYYEGGARSPSLVRWPGTITPGASSLPWAFWDALPTLLELANASSLVSGATLDGRSIVPTLLGQPQPPPPLLYWTYRDFNPFVSTDPRIVAGAAKPPLPAPGYAARVGGWKAVVHSCADPRLLPSASDKIELYALADDPGESHDVAAAHPAVLEDIRRRIAAANVSCACFQCS